MNRWSSVACIGYCRAKMNLFENLPPSVHVLVRLPGSAGPEIKRGVVENHKICASQISRHASPRFWFEEDISHPLFQWDDRTWGDEGVHLGPAYARRLSQLFCKR